MSASSLLSIPVFITLHKETSIRSPYPFPQSSFLEGISHNSYEDVSGWGWREGQKNPYEWGLKVAKLLTKISKVYFP